MTLEPKQTFGRYELIKPIAHGGIAEIWLALAKGPTGLNKTVVLKTILPEHQDDPDFLQLFINEARLAARLNHPNIVDIFDIGRRDNHYFIAMEYVDGKTLRQIQRALIQNKRGMPLWFVMHAISAVCNALEHAHNTCSESGAPLNIVHRDVTPENIMVAFDGSVKMLDFGIASASIETVAPNRLRLLGKRAYIAPECVRSSRHEGQPNVDRRSDLFSVGVILYEFLTGRLPFSGDNEEAVLDAICSDKPPRRPKEFVGAIPDEVEEIILQALAKQPVDRYQSAAAARRDIDQFLAFRSGYPDDARIADFMKRLFPSANAGSVAPPGAESTSAIPSMLSSDISTLPPDEKSSPSASLETAISDADEYFVDWSVPHEDQATAVRKRHELGLPAWMERPSQLPPPVQSEATHVTPPAPDPLFHDEETPVHKSPQQVFDHDEAILDRQGKRTTAPPPAKAEHESGPPLPIADEVPLTISPFSQNANARESLESTLPSATSPAPQVEQISKEDDMDEPRDSAMVWERLVERTRKPQGAPTTGTPSRERAPSTENLKGHVWHSLVERVYSEAKRLEDSLPDARRDRFERPRPRPISSALKTDEERALSFFDQGLECLKQRDFDGARAAWKQAVALDPGNRRYQYNLKKLPAPKDSSPPPSGEESR